MGFSRQRLTSRLLSCRPNVTNGVAGRERVGRVHYHVTVLRDPRTLSHRWRHRSMHANRGFFLQCTMGVGVNTTLDYDRTASMQDGAHV